MGDEAVAELRDLGAELRRSPRRELGQRLREAVADLDVAAVRGRARACSRGCRARRARARRATMPITSRSTPGLSGPRSTRSPTKTARRPSGWRGVDRPSAVVADERVAELGRAGSPSSARQPCTSPMTSNGPCSSRRSLSSCSRTMVARLDLVDAGEHVDRAEALLAPGRCSERRSCVALALDDVRRRSRGRVARRCARWRHRSGTSSTIATGSTSCVLGQLDEGAARLALHVGRVDDGQPAGVRAACRR